MSAHITIKLFATLGHFTPDNSNCYPVAANTSVADMLMDLDVPLEEVKIVFVNSRKADFDTVLNGGDRVGVFPAIGGG